MGTNFLGVPWKIGKILGQRLDLTVRLVTINHTGKELGHRAFELTELLRPGISAQSDVKN
jgi:hypothetical protein